MIHNRDAFLAQLAKKYGRPLQTQVEPFVAQVERYTDTRLTELSKPELVKNFVEYCKSIGIHIHITKKEQLADLTKHIVDNFGGAPVVLNKDSRLEQTGITSKMQESYEDVFVWNKELGRNPNIEKCAAANVGIVYAEAALCETGTIVLESGADFGRSVSLLPKFSLVVVNASAILPRIHQYAEKLDQWASEGKRLPSLINLISGMSSTADIELVKVVGVHGPVDIAYVIVDDEKSCDLVEDWNNPFK